MNGYTGKYRIVKKAICLTIAVAFLFNFILTDAWAVMAVSPGGMPFAAMPDKLSRLDLGSFSIPADLGLVKFLNKGDSDKLVFHIQDAHCNYAAQHKISDIIEHLNKEYGIEMVNLEGGTGEYDLSMFTDVYDKDIRRDVADYFVKWGEVNGAEFFALNNPEKVKLWGVENTDAYIKNLDVYRNSFDYKPEAYKYLKELDQPVNALKKHIFSDELLEIDTKYAQYKSNAIEFKDYLGYLMTIAKERAIKTRSFPNLYLLGHSLEEEENIDFRKANSQRDAFIEKLQRILSRNEMAELVSKTVQFRNKTIPENEFYEYLMGKGEQTNLSLEDFPEFRKYIVYISLYNAADKTMITKEMAALEAEVKETLYQNDKQKELDMLSKNLVLTRNIFDVAFTKDDYAYYKANRASFDVRNFVSFIKEEAPGFGITVDLDKNIGRLNRFRGKMFEFYEDSFERDNAFLKNIKLAGSKVKAGIIITGGFHTENLLEKFKEEDISYVSIIPSFRSEEGYESPYFSVLSGGMSPLESAIETALEAGTIQVPSIFTSLGMDLSGPRRKTLMDLAKGVMVERESAFNAAGATKIEAERTRLLRPRVFTLAEGNGYIVVTVDEQGSVDFKHIPAETATISYPGGEGNPKDFLIDRIEYDPTSLQSIRDAFHDITLDRIIADAKDPGYRRRRNYQNIPECG